MENENLGPQIESKSDQPETEETGEATNIPESLKHFEVSGQIPQAPILAQPEKEERITIISEEEQRKPVQVTAQSKQAPPSLQTIDLIEDELRRDVQKGNDGSALRRAILALNKL
jgi:hypothetical protein